MSVKKTVIVDVQTQGVEALDANIKKVETSLKGVQKEADKASNSVEDVSKNGGAIAILDSLTGGMATKFRDAYEATKLFNFSLKAMKTALIATGIGALVVALGFVVAYWDDIVEFIGGANKKLEEQLVLKNKLIETNNDQLTLLQKEEELLKAQGVDTTENLKKQRDKTLELVTQNLLLQQQLETQLKAQQVDAIRLSFGQKALNVARMIIGLPPNQLVGEIDAEEQGKIDSIIESIQKAKENVLTLSTAIVNLDKAPEIKAEKQKDRKKVTKIDTNIIKSADDDPEVLFNKVKLDLIDLQTRQAYERLGFYKAEVAADDLLKQQAIAEEEEKLRQQKIQGAVNVLNALTDLAGSETELGKALLIAKQAIAARELILSIKSTIMAAKESTTKSVLKASEAGVDIAAGAGKTAAAAPFPANIPLILGYAASAIGIIASVKAALSKQKSLASQFGGGAGGGFDSPNLKSAAPSFNVVGTSGTNQLAQSINEKNQVPIKAYVVSTEISSQQELDRNIQSEAQFG